MNIVFFNPLQQAQDELTKPARATENSSEIIDKIDVQLVILVP